MKEKEKLRVKTYEKCKSGEKIPCKSSQVHSDERKSRGKSLIQEKMTSRQDHEEEEEKRTATPSPPRKSKTTFKKNCKRRLGTEPKESSRNGGKDKREKKEGEPLELRLRQIQGEQETWRKRREGTTRAYIQSPNRSQSLAADPSQPLPCLALPCPAQLNRPVQPNVIQPFLSPLQSCSIQSSLQPLLCPLQPRPAAQPPLSLGSAALTLFVRSDREKRVQCKRLSLFTSKIMTNYLFSRYKG